MARRARFGRAIRVQLNLNGAIVAAAREMQAREDSNIMSAWQNGGTVHGKAVTDDMVLAYWKDRRKGLSKDDPLYDTASEQIDQLTYAVEQSKQDLLHLQKKISDQQFAQFYLKWAKKVPRDSEFWRVLQKDAAQLMAQSKAQSSASGERAKTEAFNKFQDGVQASDIAVADELTKAVDKMARQTGLTIEGNGDQLLSMVTDDIRNHPDEYKGLSDAIRKSRPGWDGRVTRTFFDNEITRAQHGYDQIADRARKDGFVGAYRSALSGSSAMSDWGQNVNAWDVSKSYAAREAAWTKVMNDPGATVADRLKASQDFGAWALKAAQDVTLDESVREKLNVSGLRLTGKGDQVDPAAPDFGGGVLNHGGVSNDVANYVMAQAEKKAAMDADPGSFAYAHTDKNGAYDPTGKGDIGIVPISTVPPDAVYLAQPTPTGIGVTVAQTAQPIYAQDSGNPNQQVLVGYAIEQKFGDHTVTYYNYADESGKPQWTTVSPRAAGSTETINGDGSRTWTAPPPAPDVLLAQAAEVDKQNAAQGSKTNLAEQIAAQLQAGVPVTSLNIRQSVDTLTAKDGKNVKTASTEFTVKGGRIEQTQTAYNYNATGDQIGSTTSQASVVGGIQQFDKNSVLDPSLRHAGDVPGLTANSAAALSLKETLKGMAADQAQQLLTNPMFQMQFVAQEMKSYGTQDPLDPRIRADFSGLQPNQFGADRQIGGPGTARKPAASRVDLSFPGLTNGQRPDKTTSITFAGQTIKVPGLADVQFAKRDLELPSLPAYGTAGDPIFHGQELRPGPAPAAGRTSFGVNRGANPAGISTLRPATTPSVAPVSTTPPVSPASVSTLATPTAPPSSGGNAGYGSGKKQF